MTAENILIVYKDKKKITRNQDFWNDKFSKKYRVHNFFIYDFLNYSNKKIIEKINNTILDLNIQKILFEGDHISLIDYFFIKSVNSKIKKGLFCGDDSEWHQVNLITACACDFVLSDPISSLKFNELGINSIFSTIESNENIFKDYFLEKDIDVLFFGRDKTDRQEYLKILDENNINYLSVSPYKEISNTMEKLAKLISRAKIVVNLTKSLNGKRYFNPSSKIKYGYYFKGRIIMVGLSKTLCVSEYAPHINILYPNGEVPVFKSKQSFINIINKYLSNEPKLKEDTEIFYKSSLKYGDNKYIEQIHSFIENLEKLNNISIKIPYWYYFLTIRQHFRLRSKFKKGRSYLTQFFENLKLPLYTLPLNIYFFFRFLPKLFFGRRMN